MRSRKVSEAGLATPAERKKAVDDYIANYRPIHECELRYYERRSSLTEAIDHAACARGPCWDKHGHQGRIHPRTLKQFSRRLRRVETRIRRARDFAAIHQLAEEESIPIKGIGELAAYDTACRIAAYRGLRPEAVYLHAGSRLGAGILGLDVRRSSIDKSEFPSQMQRLSADEIEDCLCIYR